jgi:hypothetical protein
VAVLSERQKKADLLAKELGQCSGTWVITPLPLNDDTRALRFQVLDSERDSVISELCSCGWIPSQLQYHPRMSPTGWLPAQLYEISIERERQTVPEGPKVSGDISELAKREEKRRAAEFISEYRKSAGLDK